MPTLQHLEYMNCLLGLAPVDAAGTAKATPFINGKECHKIGFLAMFGATTSSAADVVTLTVECSSTSASGAESQILFTYRQSGAINTNTWTAPAVPTTAAAGYAPLLSAATGTMIYIEVDPSIAPATKSDAQWFRLVSTQTSDATALLEAIVVFTDPRYKQETFISVSS